MDDPHVIALVDPDADRVAEHPVVGQRLRPQRVHFESRRLRAGLRLGSGRPFEPGLPQPEPDEDHDRDQCGDASGSTHG